LQKKLVRSLPRFLQSDALSFKSSNIGLDLYPFIGFIAASDQGLQIEFMNKG
jgi:hypothetical protein